MTCTRSAPKRYLTALALALAVGGPGAVALLPTTASAAPAPATASAAPAALGSLPRAARDAALLAAGRTPTGAPLLARRHVAGTAPRAVLGAELGRGQTLGPGDSLADPGGRYSLVNDDGVIVVRTAPNRLNSDPYDQLVAAGPAGSRLVLQNDGNLVLYSPGNEVAFATGTSGTAAARLVVQGDGNLVLYGTTTSVFYDFDTGAPADLLPGGVLLPGDRLNSTDGTTTLLMQTDGNLVLYVGGTAAFATGTTGTGIAAKVQADGNVVLYDTAGAPVYSFRTGFGPTDVSTEVLEVTSGEFRVLNVSDADVVSQFGSRWSSDTLLPGEVLLPGDRRTSVGGAVLATLQADGNFVEYDRGVAGFRVTAGADVALMQPDGNFVLYRVLESGDLRPVFNTRSSGNPGSRLVVQSDRNLVVYTPADRAVYASRR